ncbi:MAG: right-handed parallel beta-helix repeat-containing protein [Phycisphaerae bacterium]
MKQPVRRPVSKVPAGPSFLVALVLMPWPVAAQISPPSTIDADTVWSGVIEIKGEVCIRDASVRVEPGSTIRFVGGPGPNSASIRFGGSLSGRRFSSRSRLTLAGTAERPITVETPAGHPPGFISGDLESGCALVAWHVVFRGLGSAVSGKRGTPAVFLILNSPDSDLWLSHCRFTDCGRIHAEFIGGAATAEIENCTFVRTIGDTTIEFLGTGEGLRVISDNISSAAFRIECPQTLLKNNVLVGEWATISVNARNVAGIAITSNYVNCATDRDEGRYALRCSAEEAVVADNVLLGGTYVIEQSPRTVTGNVLVGAAALQPSVIPGSAAAVQLTTTHYLLSKPAPQARIADNLFLGPAYAAISAGRESPQTRIEHNLFDGWGVARRAVHFNLLVPASRDAPLAASITGNVFTRYRSVPVADAARHIGTVAQAGLNVFAEVPDTLYELGDIQKAGPGDLILRTLADLRLQAPVATRSALSAEAQLLQRQLTVSRVRQMWFDAYRPLQGSPLAGSQPAGPRPDSSPE